MIKIKQQNQEYENYLEKVRKAGKIHKLKFTDFASMDQYKKLLCVDPKKSSGKRKTDDEILEELNKNNKAYCDHLIKTGKIYKLKYSQWPVGISMSMLNTENLHIKKTTKLTISCVQIIIRLMKIFLVM